MFGRTSDTGGGIGSGDDPNSVAMTYREEVLACNT